MAELVIAVLILLVGIPLAFAAYIGAKFFRQAWKARRLPPPSSGDDAAAS